MNEGAHKRPGAVESVMYYELGISRATTTTMMMMGLGKGEAL